MSQEYLPKLFDAFSQEDSSSTNRYGSTGLGMAITKNIVEMMNGEIEVTSNGKTVKRDFHIRRNGLPTFEVRLDQPTA